MKKYKKNTIITFLLLLLLTIGISFRFINLSWGAPYFFHPDERNIASAISNLSYKKSLNPNFYAYGTLPIYSIYFLGVGINSLTSFISGSEYSEKVSFENSIILGRIISSFLSIFTLLVIFKIVNLVSTRKGAIVSLLLALFSIGYIQYAHFSTFEMWLSCLTVLLCFITLKYITTNNKKYFYILGLLLGVMLSIKISSAIFIPFIISIAFLKDLAEILKRDEKLRRIGILSYKLVLFSSIVTITLALTSPYYWLDNESFRNSISYESSVALGTLKVFYTQVFENTTPVLYQTQKVFPFILNPFVFITGLFSFLFITYKSILKKDKLVLVLLCFLLISVLSQIFLYVKWIRYYIPSLSFIYIIIGIAFCELTGEKSHFKKSSIYLSIGLIIISIIYSFSFVKTVYINTDTRIKASEWAQRNIESDEPILSEVYDMGIVPFNSHLKNLKLFNFYELENNPLLNNDLAGEVKNSDFIILPSQRIIASRLSMPTTFPRGYLFYNSLVNEIGFGKVYETECDTFCKIIYNNNPINAYEQTANVFDRPHLQIYKKLSDE